jgi:hypothetical protein
MGPEFDPVHPSGPTVYVTTFAGGERGRMVQMSTGFEAFACLTMEQLDVLIDVLQHARQRSLIDHPLRDEGDDDA